MKTRYNDASTLPQSHSPKLQALFGVDQSYGFTSNLEPRLA